MSNKTKIKKEYTKPFLTLFEAEPICELIQGSYVDTDPVVVKPDPDKDEELEFGEW